MWQLLKFLKQAEVVEYLSRVLWRRKLQRTRHSLESRTDFCERLRQMIAYLITLLLAIVAIAVMSLKIRHCYCASLRLNTATRQLLFGSKHPQSK